MSRHRQRRRTTKSRRHANPPKFRHETHIVWREASRVERLAYTRTQAAEALGISRSTFIRRVLQQVDTIDMPWGARLIPVDELERLVAERRRAAPMLIEPAAPGRPPVVPQEIVERIRAERAAGKSFRCIAAELNADGTPTVHGGAQWWPSTVQGVSRRGQ